MFEIILPNRKREYYFDKLHLKITYGNIFNNNKKEKKSNALIIVPVDSGWYDRVVKNGNKKKIRLSDKTPQKNFEDNFYNNNHELKKGRNDCYYFYKDKFILFKMGCLDETVQLTLQDISDYVRLVFQLCDVIDKESKEQLVVCPNIGGKIRFKQGSMTNRQRLGLMISVMQAYNFQVYTEITICLRKHEEKNRKYELHKL